ncbi:MAG: hypothetical protein IPL98_11700 [Saprospiraceae bacterium]|nr:hypothetical protein [Saprospiraceae bacterium]
MPKAFFRLYANNAMNFLAYPLLFFHKLLYLPANFFQRLPILLLNIYSENLLQKRGCDLVH